jgi:hypothetical protein
MAAVDRWPPVYDAEDLVREIREMAARPDVANAFYEWRRDWSVSPVADVCQGDVVHLESEVPLIGPTGEPETIEHPGGAWLVVGNTCDFARTLTEAPYTQLVPLMDLGESAGIPKAAQEAARRYTQSRRFYVPPWSGGVAHRLHVADFLRPVAVDKTAFQEGGPARVDARSSRAAWILLNACLVRFLARDDGRLDVDAD